MKAVVLLSGGMDSAVLAYHMLSEGHEIKAISYRYGQKHSRELEAAAKIAALLRIEHKEVDLSALKPLFGVSALTNDAVNVPYGHYAEESMKSTVVPNRNMIFLSVASGWCISSEFDAVCFAAHAGDHFIYPDCRPAFVNAMADVLKLADTNEVNLLTPFLNWNKGQICARGAALEVPFHMTWSCYEGGSKHCGRCGTCVERKEAFQQANLIDSVEYLS